MLQRFLYKLVSILHTFYEIMYTVPVRCTIECSSVIVKMSIIYVNCSCRSDLCLKRQITVFALYRCKITSAEAAGSGKNEINSSIFLGTAKVVDFNVCRCELLGFGRPVGKLPIPQTPFSSLPRGPRSLRALWADSSENALKLPHLNQEVSQQGLGCF